MTKYLVVAVVSLFIHLSVIAAEPVAPETEFTRALGIIEQTQLNIFTQQQPKSTQQILTESNRQLAVATDQTARIETMRNVLSEAIDQYNDQYANYITPEALKRYREQRTGSYHGIGLKFRAMADDYPLVIGPLTGGPLENSNLQPGDQIIKADDTDLKGMSSSEIVKRLKGPEATVVNLQLNRNGISHTVTATRSPVKLEYARAEVIDGDIGYLKISRFGGNTHEKVRQLVKQLLNQSVSAFVLDLRGNPGGSTRAARSITSIFIRQEHVYCERYKSGERRLLPRHGNHLTDLPLAVLVNGDSMSASEIVAGALQTFDRGVIVGEPTFGKGLVQKVFNLAQPLGGAIRTTIAEFATPNGKPIHAAGIVPDKYIRTDADFMFQRTGSLNISDRARAYQRVLLEQRVRKDYPDTDEKLIAAADQQLQMAITTIRHPQISSRDD